jgi:hypothetical protein
MPIAGCGEVIAGIEALTAAGRYRYPDLGDKDADLRRLSMGTDTIRMRGHPRRGQYRGRRVCPGEVPCGAG